MSDSALKRSWTGSADHNGHKSAYKHKRRSRPGDLGSVAAIGDGCKRFLPSGLAYSNASHCVEVEVDVETGAVSILRYVVVSDCGRLINPRVVEGQIVGGVIHGIGNALFERMVYDDNAQPITTNLAEYILPSATGLPKIEVLHHFSPSPLNPLGVKGVGECGLIPAAAAIISAIEDALEPFDVHIAETPILPAQLVQLCAEKATRE